MLADRARPSVAALADLAGGAVVLLLGGWAAARGDAKHVGPLLLVLAAAVAAAGARRWPAVALAGIWVIALVQLDNQAAALGCAIAIAIVAYRSARYGSRPTLWAAGLSIPVAAVVAAVLALNDPQVLAGERTLVAVVRASSLGVVSGFLAVVALLAAPYAVGVAARLNSGYRQARAEREVAEARAAVEHDLAQARAEQTRLTRDVHDIVGHSLAVIIAQADSAHARTADEQVRTALAQIASVGRSSLAEVRDVLASTQDAPGASPPTAAPDLDDLVAGVRSAGNDVHETVVGESAALDEQTGAVAYRVLQEMLTNSLKHGRSGGRIEVERAWTAEGLKISVANAACNEGSGVGVGVGGVGVGVGMGLSNLRSRLEAVGGTLQVSPGERFVTTAFVPGPGRAR